MTTAAATPPKAYSFLFARNGDGRLFLALFNGRFFLARADDRLGFRRRWSGGRFLLGVIHHVLAQAWRRRPASDLGWSRRR